VTTIATLTADQVEVGQELPVLSYEVTATTVVLGALAARDWRPMHHDHDFAVNRNGTRDIFVNTPNLAAWFERYLTDWTGPLGRLGRMKFRMKGSIFPGDTMVFVGTVTAVNTDESGCHWAAIDVSVSVADEIMTSCAATIAVPVDESDNPWARRSDRWNP
jgi:acyl dehydratase